MRDGGVGKTGILPYPLFTLGCLVGLLSARAVVCVISISICTVDAVLEYRIW